jgi:coenzyme F420-reducing hydrogenase alpha subunit
MTMQTMTFEPLRWQVDPCRVTVRSNGTGPTAYYQVLSPGNIQSVCCGRPVEELPRILTLLAPAHHLAAAQALDRLFGVTPPEMAVNMRTALLQAQTCSAHLRTFYFLTTAFQAPFVDFRNAGRAMPDPALTQRFSETIMHHAALAQEAEDILGGRRDHPLSAVTGGVSRYLKEGHYARLAHIGERLVGFSQEMGQRVCDTFLDADWLHRRGLDFTLPAMAGMHVGADGQPVLTPADGTDGRPLEAETLDATIALHTEAWTYQPFACLQSSGWPGLAGGSTEGFFCVGPLARFNAGQPAATPLAETLRQQVIERLGAPPCHRWSAAMAAMAVELVQAAETLQQLGQVEALTGPALRSIPKAMTGDTTWAVLETPQGMTWHRYAVDAQGIVADVTLIDSRAANNALKCLLSQVIVTAASERQAAPAAVREQLALALLPF